MHVCLGLGREVSPELGLEASFITNVLLKGTRAEATMTNVHTINLGDRKVDMEGLGDFPVSQRDSWPQTGLKPIQYRPGGCHSLPFGLLQRGLQ